MDAVRLNGRETQEPSGGDGASRHQPRMLWNPKWLVEGTNVLEIDVYNGHRGSRPENRMAGPVALRIELEETVRSKSGVASHATPGSEKQKEVPP